MSAYMAFAQGLAEGKRPLAGYWEVRLRACGLFDQANLARELTDPNTHVGYDVAVGVYTRGASEMGATE